MGTPGRRGFRLDLAHLGLSTLGDTQIDHCFSEEEVWKTILEIPVDKAPGPDGFTGAFYRHAWPIIKEDVMNAFHALWSLDGRSLYLLNQAYIFLLRKKPDACLVSDFRPISLIHSFIKLFTKVLAGRLAPQMDKLVSLNQSAFIRVECCMTISKRHSLQLNFCIEKRSQVLCSSWTFQRRLIR